MKTLLWSDSFAGNAPFSSFFLVFAMITEETEFIVRASNTKYFFSPLTIREIYYSMKVIIISSLDSCRYYTYTHTLLFSQ